MTHLLKHGARYRTEPLTPKAVWFDVDNTLVDDNSPNLPSKRFINAADKSGKIAHLGLATARPLPKAEHIIKAANLKGISILSNGAQIYDGQTEKMIVEYVLPLQETDTIIRTLQKLGIQHWVSDDGSDHFWLGNANNGAAKHLGEYVVAKDIWTPAEGNNRHVIAEYSPTKPLVIVADGASESAVESISNIVKDVDNITSLVAHQIENKDGSTSYKVFILNTQANKHDALLNVMAMLGISRSETMAVGDGPNDTIILAGAGIGVAVANAVDATKEAATYIAPSMAEDGAAIALEELILGSSNQRT